MWFYPIEGHIDIIRRYSTPLKWHSDNAAAPPISSVVYHLGMCIVDLIDLPIQSTDIAERHEVTKLLARMFSPKGSQLAVENRPLWNCFLQR